MQKKRRDIAGYSNAKIYSMVSQQGLEDLSYKELLQLKKERKEKFQTNQKVLFDKAQRVWLKKNNKEEYIDFNEQYRRKIYKYFSSMDTDGGGSIGPEELDGPLITLGIARNRDEVIKIMSEIDDDLDIKFDEFLTIIGGKSDIFGKKSDKKDQSQLIVEFFKGIVDGKVGNEAINQDSSFDIILSKLRRKKMLKYFQEHRDPQDEAEAMRLMKDWEKWISQHKEDENKNELPGYEDASPIPDSI